MQSLGSKSGGVLGMVDGIILELLKIGDARNISLNISLPERTLWILEHFFPFAHVVLAFVARLLWPLLLDWVGSGTRFIFGRCEIER